MIFSGGGVHGALPLCHVIRCGAVGWRGLRSLGLTRAINKRLRQHRCLVDTSLCAATNTQGQEMSRNCDGILCVRLKARNTTLQCHISVALDAFLPLADGTILLPSLREYLRWMIARRADLSLRWTRCRIPANFAPLFFNSTPIVGRLRIHAWSPSRSFPPTRLCETTSPRHRSD